MSHGTGTPSGGLDLGSGPPNVGSILSASKDAVLAEPLTVAVAFVGGVLAAVPILGSVFQFVAYGIIAELLGEADGSGPVSGESLGIRLLIGFISSLIGGIAILIGLVLFVIPGVYLALKFWLVLPAAILDGRGILDALAESWGRTDGHLGTVFGVGLVVGVVSLSIALAVIVPLFLTGFQNQVILQAIAGAVLSPITAWGLATQVTMYRRFEPTTG